MLYFCPILRYNILYRKKFSAQIPLFRGIFRDFFRKISPFRRYHTIISIIIHYLIIMFEKKDVKRFFIVKKIFFTFYKKRTVFTVFKGEKSMRIDKFLKVSRILKRRTVAQEACSEEKVLINGKAAKPSTAVKIGDVVEVLYAAGSLKFRILNIKETVKKDEAASLYEVLV